MCLSADYDIEAVIEFYGEVESAAQHGVASGYFPLHRFACSEHLIGGVHVYPETGKATPGTKTLVHIKILGWEHYSNMVCVGETFFIQEGFKRVGEGLVRVTKNKEM